jgi:hypothetical protein
MGLAEVGELLRCLGVKIRHPIGMIALQFCHKLFVLVPHLLELLLLLLFSCAKKIFVSLTNALDFRFDVLDLTSKFLD